jgi:hypothetical protein
LGLLATVLLSAAGCLPSVQSEPNLSDDEIVKLVSGIALNANVSCDDIKAAFGMPHVPTVETPAELNVEFEEVRLPNGRGAELRVWYMPAALDRGTVILSMGAVGDMSCFLFIGDMLYLHGWSVVMYDPQGFGGSSGEPNVQSLYGDLATVVAWTGERTGRSQFTLMGVSIGTVPTVAYAVDHPEQVNAVVLDGPISLRDEMARFRGTFGTAYADALRVLDPQLLFDNTVPALRQPVLAMLYGQDEFVTSSVFEQLAATSSADVKTVWFEDLGHARGPYLASSRYFYELDQFLIDIYERSPAD